MAFQPRVSARGYWGRSHSLPAGRPRSHAGSLLRRRCFSLRRRSALARTQTRHHPWLRPSTRRNHTGLRTHATRSGRDLYPGSPLLRHHSANPPPPANLRRTMGKPAEPHTTGDHASDRETERPANVLANPGSQRFAMKPPEQRYAWAHSSQECSRLPRAYLGALVGGDIGESPRRLEVIFRVLPGPLWLPPARSR